MSLLTNLEAQNPLLTDTDIKFFLPCDEIVGVGTMTDSVSGATLGTGNIPDGNGTIDVAEGANIAFTGSSNGLSITAGNDWAMFCVIEGTFLQSFRLGSTAGHSISIAPSGNVTIVGDAGAAVFNVAGDFPPSGVQTKLLIASDFSGNTTTYIAAQGVALAAGTPQVAATEHGNMDDIRDFYTSASFAGNCQLTGNLLVDLPNGIPADIVTMADWTMEQWLANNKKFYPRMTEL